MNYTAADIAGVGAGFALFALFAFAPGYTVGWLSNVFAFRRRRLATRVAAAVPLSIGVMPIAAYLLWRCWLPLVWVVFGACGAACVVLLARDARALGLRLTRAGWGVLGIAAGWLVGGTLSLVDWQFGDRLYFPFSSYDRMTRTAFAAALARDGVPPHNPFFFAGQPAPLRYHYFWMIPAALVHRLGGGLVSPRLALIAGVLWSGLGLMAVVALYLRFFQSKGGEQIERRTLIAVSLLGVTGLDIIPVFLIDVAGRGILPSIEWWNTAIASWINTVLWVPHDLAGLTAGLAGFLICWNAARQEDRRQWIAGLLLGGLAFASAVGCSIYAGGTVAAGCVLWIAVAAAKRWWRQGWVVASAGATGVLLLMPFILQLLHGMGKGTSGPSGGMGFLPFTPTVRTFLVADLMAEPTSLGHHLLLLNAVMLPVNYFLEFGFFFVVACVGTRRIWRSGVRDQAEWAAVTLGVASLLICTFMRSTVISVNDLGIRSALVLQFVLLLWAAELWDEGSFKWPLRGRAPAGAPGAAPFLVPVMIVLGVLGSCYELCLQRTFPILSDHFSVKRYTWLAPDRNLGARTLALRRAYDEMNSILPASAVVQAEPKRGIGNLDAELYSGRQMVADVGDCGTVFGGSAAFCSDVMLPQLEPLFNGRQPVTAAEVEKTCREFSIDALLFEDTDPVWKDKSSWIWRAPPILSNRFVRVIRCGPAEYGLVLAWPSWKQQ